MCNIIYENKNNNFSLLVKEMSNFVDEVKNNDGFVSITSNGGSLAPSERINISDVLGKSYSDEAKLTQQNVTKTISFFMDQAKVRPEIGVEEVLPSHITMDAFEDINPSTKKENTSFEIGLSA